MTSNMSKNFKMKSKLRGMADGGSVADYMSGKSREQQLKEASGEWKPAAAPKAGQPDFRNVQAKVTSSYDEKKKSALQRLFGMADGGDVSKLGMGMARPPTLPVASGVVKTAPSTYTDQTMGAAAGKAWTPSTTGPGLSVVSTKGNVPSSGGTPSPYAPKPATPSIETQIGSLMQQLRGQQPAAAPSPMTAPTPTIASTLRTNPPPVTPLQPGMGAQIALQSAQAGNSQVLSGGSGGSSPYPAVEYADGGKVRGPGGPTEDKVGPVMLSDGEYVLPADTVEAIGKENLDKLRAATHTPVDAAPDGKANGFFANAAEKVKNAWSSLRAPVAGEPMTYALDQGPGMRGGAPGTPVSTAMQVAPKDIPSSNALVTENTARGFRVADRVAKVARPLAALGGAMSAYDIYKNGANAENVGDLGASAAGFAGPVASKLGLSSVARFAGPVGAAAATGWGIGRVVGGLLPDNVNDAIGGTVNEVGLMAKKRLGVGWGDPNAYVPPTVDAPDSSDARGGVATRQNPPNAVDTAMGQIRRGDKPQGFEETNFPGIYGRNNPNSGKRGESARQYVGAGAPTAGPDPLTSELMSALRGSISGGQNNGGGYSTGYGNASAINDRFDKLASRLSGMYSSKGQGNLARHLVEIEGMRQRALEADAGNLTTQRGQGITAADAANERSASARNSALQTMGQLLGAQYERDAKSAAKLAADAEEVYKVTEGRQEDVAKSLDEVASTAAAGDKKREAQYSTLLTNLPSEELNALSNVPPAERKTYLNNVILQQEGRNEGLVLGRDRGAAVQNAAIGGLLGNMTRFKGGGAKVGALIDKGIGLIPRVGRPISRLHPAENLMRLGPALGALAGAYVTPEVENYDMPDPVAYDPESGAPLPAPKNLREAARYGAWDVYLNPLDQSVQTVSGRRTNRPTPTEEQAARRARSILRGGE